MGLQRFGRTIINGLFCGPKKTLATLPQLIQDEDKFEVHPEVRTALSQGDPVVALETTIVTHGMPHPHNVQTAMEVEGIIRNEGAVPATIGVLDGVIHVGLSSSELQHLASAPSVHKISRRDLAFSLCKNWTGGTTVAGTMMCAHRAGIPVFVTGGIGGVHREGENSLDISADLTELGRTPVGVVCAGIKSILDVGRTLEYLETQGVPVVTMGEGGVVPAFFTAQSGYKTPHSVCSPTEAARLIDSSTRCGVDSGMVFTVPIPTEARSLGVEIEEVIQQALLQAKSEGIQGKEITPFVLRRINEVTEGKSLQANIALIKNNACVGGQIAVELARLRRARQRIRQPLGESGGEKRVAGAVRGNVEVREEPRAEVKVGEEKKEKRGVVVIGAAVVDFTAKLLLPHIQTGATNPGSVALSYGGVARNIAECMSRLGAPPLFLSAVGKDRTGQLIRDNLLECGVGVAGVSDREEERTAMYCVVLDHTGEFNMGIGDMDIADSISVDWVQTFSAELAGASHVCMDGNLPKDTMRFILQHCSVHNTPVWFEPTCVLKSTKPMSMLQDLPGAIQVATPNLLELRSMYEVLSENPASTQSPADMTLKEKLAECSVIVRPVMTRIPFLVVSLGKDGVLCCSTNSLPHLSLDFPSHSQDSPHITRSQSSERVCCLHYPAVTDDRMSSRLLSVSGAGDSFVGGMLAGLSGGLALDHAVKAGLQAAALSLQSMSAVSSCVDPSLLQPETIQQRVPSNSLIVHL